MTRLDRRAEPLPPRRTGGVVARVLLFLLAAASLALAALPMDLDRSEDAACGSPVVEIVVSDSTDDNPGEGAATCDERATPRLVAGGAGVLLAAAAATALRWWERRRVRQPPASTS